jgi:hypothetical protein
MEEDRDRVDIFRSSEIIFFGNNNIIIEFSKKLSDVK